MKGWLKVVGSKGERGAADWKGWRYGEIESNGKTVFTLHLYDPTRPNQAISDTTHTSKGRRQNSLPLVTNFSQKLTRPSKGIIYPVGDLCRRFTKRTLPLPIHYIVI